MAIFIVGNTEESIRKYLSNRGLPNDFVSIKDFIEKEKLEEPSCPLSSINNTNKLIRDVSVFSNRVKDLYEEDNLPNIYYVGEKTEIRPTILIFIYTEVHIENPDGTFKITRKKPEGIYHGDY